MKEYLNKTDRATQFLQNVQFHLTRQGQENNQFSHADPSIRAFNRGLLKYFQMNFQFEAQIANIGVDRSTLDPAHMADLLARAAQFMFRNEEITDYANYADTRFYSWFENLAENRLENYLRLLRTKNVATHIPERYRALGVICALLSQSQNRDLNVVDWGCSLNLGLRAVLVPQYLIRDTTNGHSLKDETPKKLITGALIKGNVTFHHAVGIDIQPFDPRWVFACSYYGPYEIARTLLEQDTKELKGRTSKILDIKLADVTANGNSRQQEELLEIMLGNTRKLDIVHASMMMYQLSPELQKLALQNAEYCLRDGGLFVELTFEDVDQWSKPWNILTTVRVKEARGLSDPFIWLRWNNSRCGEVHAEKDFVTINQLLGEEIKLCQN